MRAHTAAEARSPYNNHNVPPPPATSHDDPAVQRLLEIMNEPPAPSPPFEPRPTTTSAPHHHSPFHDLFECPELEHRMKRFLVRLANETANHLIRDTLEPDPTSIVWQPMTSLKGIAIERGRDHERLRRNGTSAAVASANAVCLRGSTLVHGSVEEFAVVFRSDTLKPVADHTLLLNPDLLDMVTLYALVQPSGEHPRRYVGIKWALLQAPNRLFRHRDFCYLECQKEFCDANGRRGWVRSLHSIKIPCCPGLEHSHDIVRASFYRCGLIAVETDTPGELRATYTIELDPKGHAPMTCLPRFIAHRIAALSTVDRFLQQQRLSSTPLLGDLDIPVDRYNVACQLCYRTFSTFAKRFVCRKCGNGVCKHCSQDWVLDLPVIGRRKVRICTVCSAEARYAQGTLAMVRLTPQSRRHVPGNVRQQAINRACFQRSRSLPDEDEMRLRGDRQGPTNAHAQQQEQQDLNGSRTRRARTEATPQRPQHQEEDEDADDQDLDRGLSIGNNNNIRETTDVTHMWNQEEAQEFFRAARIGPMLPPGTRLSALQNEARPPHIRRSQSVQPSTDRVWMPNEPPHFQGINNAGARNPRAGAPLPRRLSAIGHSGINHENNSGSLEFVMSEGENENESSTATSVATEQDKIAVLESEQALDSTGQSNNEMPIIDAPSDETQETATEVTAPIEATRISSTTVNVDAKPVTPKSMSVQNSNPIQDGSNVETGIATLPVVKDSPTPVDAKIGEMESPVAQAS